MAAQITIISDQSTLVGFPEWPLPVITLQAGQAGFDLKPTMPAGVPGGGTFGVRGVLPAGVTLTTDGVISMAAGASSFSPTAAQFTYTLP